MFLYEGVATCDYVTMLVRTESIIQCLDNWLKIKIRFSNLFGRRISV